MNVYFVIALQASVLTGAGQTTAQDIPSDEQPIIWRDFRMGMTPELVAEHLRKIEGIKSVDVTRRGKKPVRVKIGYSIGDSISIGNLDVAVNPSFLNDRLDSINLSDTKCYSAIEAKLEGLLAALAEKYPQQQGLNVVNADGVSVDKQRAFYNTETRVTVSILPIENPYPQHLYGGTGFLAAANKFANSLADSNYQSAIAACPTDKGRKATLQLDYSSQEQFEHKHRAEKAAREAQAQATKDGL